MGTDDNGFERVPERYANDGGRETIDRIRDTLGDEGFVAWCVGNVLKYGDRAGKKGDPAGDEAKIKFYMEMADHVREFIDRRISNPEWQFYKDPRHARAGFRPYVRHVSGTVTTSPFAYQTCPGCGYPTSLDGKQDHWSNCEWKPKTGAYRR